MRRTLILFLLAGLAFAAPVAASDTYAGLTRAQAIAKAESGVIALGVAIQGWSPAQAVKIRHQLDAIDPKATHSTCARKPAWRVLWPKSTPIYVNRKGLIPACVFRVTQSAGHRSGCHSHHTCPSDHGTYAWRGLTCVRPGATEMSARFTIRVTYGGLPYLCHR